MSSEMADTRRLFLALWPGEEERQAMAGLAQKIPGGRRVPTENLHLTLAFLGATTDQRVACYEDALRDIEVPSLTLVLDRLGYWRKPRILWLGASQTPPALEDLTTELNRRLATCGFTPEKRPFRAHLTLARKHPGPAPVKILVEPVHWSVDRIVLCESVTAKEGARYRLLRRWPESRVSNFEG